MTTLVAIGFLDETSAGAAAAYLRRLACDILLDDDAVAVVSRDEQGTCHVTTSHQALILGSVRGVFWLPLLSVLCFVPLFGTAAGGGTRVARQRIQRSGVVEAIGEPVLDMLQPGTSVLFFATGPTVPFTAVANVLRRFSGTVVAAPLPPDLAPEVHRALNEPPVDLTVMPTGDGADSLSP